MSNLAAVRDRIIGTNPCEGVRLPARRRTAGDDRIIAREQLPAALPGRHRALVGLAAGTGLRRGECTGLRWEAVDLEAGTLRVERTAVEVAGNITSKPYPKTKAGRREVPLPGFVVGLLPTHRELYSASVLGEIFTNSAGGPVRRTLSVPGSGVLRSWQPVSSVRSTSRTAFPRLVAQR
ncbi:site-specific integrase [Nonomuraea soli]|uniref:site-specific integrase n=1 Tax=Nonomuraea soli TaxID=1032476 RepID=UPI0015EBBF2B